jgi:hypothetical protein
MKTNDRLPAGSLAKENAGRRATDEEFARALELMFYVTDSRAHGGRLHYLDDRADEPASPIEVCLWSQLRHAYGFETPGASNNSLHLAQINREFERERLNPVGFSVERLTDDEIAAGVPNRWRLSTEDGYIEVVGNNALITRALDDLLSNPESYAFEHLSNAVKATSAAELLRTITESGMDKYMPEEVVSGLKIEAESVARRLRERVARLERFRAGFGTAVLRLEDARLDGAAVGIVEPGEITTHVELLEARDEYRDGARVDVATAAVVPDTFPRRIMRVGCRGHIWDGQIVEVVGAEDEGRGLRARILDDPDRETMAFPFTALDELGFVERAEVGPKDLTEEGKEEIRQLLERHDAAGFLAVGRLAMQNDPRDGCRVALTGGGRDYGRFQLLEADGAGHNRGEAFTRPLSAFVPDMRPILITDDDRSEFAEALREIARARGIAVRGALSHYEQQGATVPAAKVALCCDRCGFAPNPDGEAKAGDRCYNYGNFECGGFFVDASTVDGPRLRQMDAETPFTTSPALRRSVEDEEANRAVRFAGAAPVAEGTATLETLDVYEAGQATPTRRIATGVRLDVEPPSAIPTDGATIDEARDSVGTPAEWRERVPPSERLRRELLEQSTAEPFGRTHGEGETES